MYPQDSSVADGVLSVGGCDVRELAREFGTPAYVVAEADLRAAAQAFTAALAEAHGGPGEVVLVFCHHSAVGSGPILDLRLVVPGTVEPHEAPETIELSPEQLRDRILVVEFGPAGLDIVLATPDYREVIRLYRFPSSPPSTRSSEAS